MNARDTQTSPPLAERLHAAGLTPAEIADACEIDPATARNWVAGRSRKPHPRNMRMLEELLREHNNGRAT